MSKIVERLLKPSRRVAVWDFASEFFHAEIRILCTGAAWLAERPEASGWVRGALGDALLRSASAEAIAGHPCPWIPPCTLDPLFRDQGEWQSGQRLPKPFVPFVEAVGGDALVSIRLFGFATDWTESVTDALTVALRNGLGPKHGRTKLEIAGRDIRTFEGIEPAQSVPASVELDFLSPLSIRQGNDPHLDPGALLAALKNRAAGLSRWHDADLDTHSDDAVDFTVAFNTEEVAWARRGGPENRRYAVSGFMGRIAISGNLTPLLPYLALGQIAHIGGRTTLGMGRYHLRSDQW